jgi:hypothetical protein
MATPLPEATEIAEVSLNVVKAPVPIATEAFEI